MTNQRRAQIGAPSEVRNRALRAAMWSVYYNTLNLQTLRRPLVRAAEKDFGPIPLDEALRRVVDADDPGSEERRFRVLGQLGMAGLTTRARLDELRAMAHDAEDPDWLAHIDAVEIQLGRLSQSLDIASTVILDKSRSQLLAFLLELMRARRACLVIEPSCETTYTPFDASGRPFTTVTARAKVNKTPTELARTIDPRSWGTCLDHFETLRVLPKNAAGDFLPFGPDADPIGQPWSAASAPHLFWERVTIETAAGSNVFENILRITSFTVAAAATRLDFVLEESRKLEYPALFLDLPACVTIDEGYSSAVTTVGPGGGNWSQIEVFKKVQFVDFTAGGANPFGYDPGELLNYLAPTSLCLWLEDATRGSPCCHV